MGKGTAKPGSYPRILLRVIGAEAVFVIGVILVAQIFHVDPNGGSYWSEATEIALMVFLFLIAPAFVLTFFGGYGAVVATPFAAFAFFMCISPYTGMLFDVAGPVWFALIALAFVVAMAFMMHKKRQA